MSNENKKIYFTISFLFILIFGSMLLFGIYNNSRPVQSVSDQLERVGEYQSDTIRQLNEVECGISANIERVKQAEERAETITESAIGIQEQNSNIYESIRESQQRIADSKRILEEIRKTKR